MKYNFKLLLGLLLLSIVLLPREGKGQQDPVYSQYMNNMLTIQPAYAGLTGYTNVTGLSRVQWIGFDGSPVTNTLTIQGPFNRYNIGFGVSLINDKFGPVRQNALYTDYAYRILLDNSQYLSFGIKGGFNRYEALLSQLPTHDPNDPSAVQDIYRKYLPNFGFGFLWHSDVFFVGFSVPKFFKNRINSDSGFSIYQEEVRYYAMGGIVVPVTDVVKFKPTFLYHWSDSSPNIVDITANFLLYDRIWAGATYRYKNACGILLQAIVQQYLKVGYAYDLTTFRPSQVNSGTHEFMLSYDIPYKQKRRCCVTPRYF